MLSAVILSVHSYPAMLLAEQLVHQRYVHPGPLVLGTNPVKFPTRIADRDRTVSRRSEPSSRTTLIGEQPNPWDLMTVFRLCSTCTSRSQAGFCHCTLKLISDQPEPTIARLRYSLGGDRPSQTTHHTGSHIQIMDDG